MIYKKLGNSGIKVSELCLGTMTCGRETCEKMSLEMISRFLDTGGNFIDTADVYEGANGVSEKIVGAALKGRRNSFIVATKCGFSTSAGPNQVGTSRIYLMQAAENSLRRLKTDYIDLYYLHIQDEVTPWEETLSTLDMLVKTGKIRYLGVSNFTAWQIMKALGISARYGWERFIAYQPQYNLLEREIEKEFIPLCQKEGLGIVSWAPLAGGFLTGKYCPNKSSSKAGRLLQLEKEETDSWDKRATQRSFRIVEVVKAIAKERKKSCSQVALNWIRKNPLITAPIIGARTMQQLEDNLACVDWELTQEEIQALDEVSRIEERYPYDFINRLGRR